ncbi:Cytochrome P450 97B3, chloroplastic [Penicillium subrubescens]|uniref:Cytochrome P450 97B3, chloroplastic n=1 Tax=Penicillium subrubescens TaxID=1316194 RepID=A0A1Q5UFA5_9EURO|nr:Cytochrome P450 97B3, chloroplastic [Penicillium subrubescens]
MNSYTTNRQLQGPLIGAKVFMRHPRGRITIDWLRTIPNEGLIHFREALNYSFLLATNHRALVDVLSTNSYDFIKPPGGREFFARGLGYGLILSEGDAHRAQRKAVTPAFTIKNIRAMYPLMWTKTQLFLSQLEKEIRFHPAPGTDTANAVGFVEIGSWASRLTLDIIGPAAIGRDFQSLENENDPVSKNYSAIFKPSGDFLLLFGASLLLPQWLVKLIPCKANLVLPRNVKYLRQVFHYILHEKRALLAREKGEQELADGDILGTMMRGGEFSDSELVDQMLTFLAAGHETTAGAFTWCCYHLCIEPEIQTNLREEIRATIASPAASVSWQDLEGMPYLNGVCQEVLRLYPTLPMSGREAIRETTIAGKKIPKGTTIVLCPQSINRSPEFWGNTADQFLPERWIDTDDKGKQTPNKHGGAPTNFAQITFLHGPRACIGKDFAKAEFRCAVAGIFGLFRCELKNPEQQITFGGTLTSQPLEGMHLKLSKLEGWE